MEDFLLSQTPKNKLLEQVRPYLDKLRRGLQFKRETYYQSPEEFIELAESLQMSVERLTEFLKGEDINAMDINVATLMRMLYITDLSITAVGLIEDYSAYSDPSTKKEFKKTPTGAIIRSFREARTESIEQVADMSTLSSVMLKELETGTRELYDITFSSFFALCNWLEIPVQCLFKFKFYNTCEDLM